MKHVNGLAVVNLNAKTVPQTYYYDGNTGKASSVRAASTTTATVWPSVNFSSSTKPYSTSNTSSLKRYLAIVKPNTATTISTTATSGCEAWSLSYNVNQNTSSSQSVTSSRPGYYLGRVYSYKGAVETFTAPENANYKLEVWGASGSSEGGYSTGMSTYTKNQRLYVCVGGKGAYSVGSQSDGGYNGGGNSNPTLINNIFGGGGGGGATHIANKLEGTGELVNYESHRNEILLVAGGGGSGDHGAKAGYGGGINGTDGDYDGADGIGGKGGTQTQGGDGAVPGTFGKGGDYGVAYLIDVNGVYDSGGCGGGGWYGGGSPKCKGGGCGGGGSGHVGDVTNGQTIAGNTSFPSPSGGTETGHTGNGYAIITQVSY